MSKVVFACLLFCMTTLAASDNNLNFNKRVTFPEQQLTINVAIANTREQREAGLMHHSKLEDQQGMLFVFSGLTKRGVWMKNTLLALDVIFFDEKGRIVATLNDLQPCYSTACPTYESTTPAQYMLELKAGFIDHHSLKVGQHVTLP